MRERHPKCFGWAFRAAVVATVLAAFSREAIASDEVRFPVNSGQSPFAWLLIYLLYTIGVGFIAYLVYAICRALAPVVLLILFVAGGVIARLVAIKFGAPPLVAVLVAGVWVGLSSITCFMLESIDALQSRVDVLNEQLRKETAINNERDVARFVEMLSERPTAELKQLYATRGATGVTRSEIEACRCILVGRGELDRVP